MRDIGPTSDSDANSLGKFGEMVRLMADRAIDELPDCEFAETTGDARDRAGVIVTVWGQEMEVVTGGFKITKATPSAIGIDTRYVLTRDSPQWSELHEKYTGELATLRKCVEDLQSWRHDPPISHLEWVYRALYQRDNLTGDEFTDMTEEHPEITGQLGKDTPVWDNVAQMKMDVNSWSGQFIKALEDIYLMQLPHHLNGQAAVTGYLLGSLQLSQKAVKLAELDVSKVLDGTISALEELGNIRGLSLSEGLNVVSQAVGAVGVVTSLIPGGQAIAGGLATTSAVAGLGGQLAGKIEGKPDAEAKVMKIEGDSVDEIADSLQSEVKKCLNQIAAVENGCADMLSELSEIIDQNHVVNGNIPTAASALTARDAYFRPKPVRGGEGGQRLAGDSSTAVLTIDDVDVLALMGASTFPLMAAEFRGMNKDLESVEDGFLSEALVRTTIGEKSHLHEIWVKVQGQLSTLFTESATNLDDVGEVVVGAAVDIDGTDQANGTRIKQSTRELIDG